MSFDGVVLHVKRLLYCFIVNCYGS